MPPKSLTELAMQACKKNVRSLHAFGYAPYHLIRPILLKVDNPQQLREIEKTSPQICGDDAELWITFIKRDVRDWEKRQIEPKNPESWHKVYRKLRKEDEDRIREAQEKLKADMDNRKAEKQSNQMGFVDRVINPVRKSIPKPRMIADRSGYMSSLHFGSGSRTSAATGKSTMNKVRRETREASVFGARKTALSTPTHLLNQNTSHGRVIGPRTTAGVHEAITAQTHTLTAPRSVQNTSKASLNIRPSILPQPQSQPQPQLLQQQTPPRPSPLKRAAPSVFMPRKRRI